MAEATPMMAPRVCLADESGELAATRALLHELHITWDEYGGQPREGGFDLLISTPRHALSKRVEGPKTHARTHIVVGDELSRTLRKELERHPCDYVVESPLHPAALRLLIEHSLYRGPERRTGLRAMLAAEVKFKAGLLSKKATLMQLSERGAGMMVDQPVSAERITLKLPSSWTGSGKLDLKARVADQHLYTEGGHLVSVVFEGLDLATRRRLRGIMKKQAAGDGLLEPTSPEDAAKAADAAAAAPGSAPRPATSAPAPSERRESTRMPFSKRVLATLRGQAQAVVSRDISAGGMRLEPDAALSVGDELKLALYGAKGSPPLVLRAEVVNDHDEHGLGLRFVDVGDEMRRRLDRLVGQSPILGAADDKGERPKMVVTEILDREEGE